MQGQEPRSKSQGEGCKDHAGAMDTRVKKAEPSRPRKSQILVRAEPGTKSHARTKSQGTRAKNQEATTKSHKDWEPRTMQEPCHAMEQEPRIRSKEPSQPTNLRYYYNGLLPTDFLKQILIGSLCRCISLCLTISFID